MQENQKPDEPQTPKIEDIAAELKELGYCLKGALKSTLETERMQNLQTRASENLDGLIKAVDGLIQETKSGKLEKDLRRGLYQCLQSVNNKLRDYTDSVKSGKD
jgi:hypothetical protein